MSSTKSGLTINGINCTAPEHLLCKVMFLATSHSNPFDISAPGLGLQRARIRCPVALGSTFRLTEDRYIQLFSLYLQLDALSMIRNWYCVYMGHILNSSLEDIIMYCQRQKL